LNENADNWLGWANVAWSYFQPGVGVNSTTGLHYAAVDWHRFTDWDLGVYISAIIDAERLGLISREEPWGFNHRLEKVLGFLETRPLTDDRLPYAQYDADTEGVPDDVDDSTAHVSDVGKLLLALDDLRSVRPDLAFRIQSVVARHNLELFAQDSYFGGNGVYEFYAAQGYWAFGYSTPELRDLEALGEGRLIDVYGQKLPKAWITSEPLMLAILEDRTNELYRDYADRVFSAQQKRYELTGKFTTFSEGAYPAPHYYVYEWVLTGKGEKWVVWAGENLDESEVVYSKIAFAFHAVYNNEYTNTLVEKVLPLATETGFLEGITEDGKTVAVLNDKTNGLILQAVRYSMFSTSELADSTSMPTFPRYAITTFVVSHGLIDEQLQLLRAVDAHNFTLVYKEDDPNRVRSIHNAFKNYTDCIIPELSFMQTLMPSNRERIVDAKFEAFKSVSGRYPSGIFSFQLDTYTLNYVKDKFEASFAVGNVWDQVNIDFMSLRGGFALPYYASRRHNLMPARTEDEASVLVTPPFVIAPTNRYHFDNNHIIDLCHFGVDIEEFKYLSLNYPFFTPFFLELDWLVHVNSTELFRFFVESYTWVYKNFNALTADQFAEIFKSHFPTTPEYHFMYRSSNSPLFPETEDWKIEWLMNPDYRIARVGDNVVSSLDYSAQKEDPFLSSSKSINFTGPRFGEDPSNIIRTDLSFDIDDLWQSEYGDRRLTKMGYVIYTGTLQDFYDTSI
jgi:hypothetical protein